MKKIAVVLVACLACAGQARRVQPSLEQLQRVEGTTFQQPLQALASLLLESRSTAAFHLPSRGMFIPHGNPTPAVSKMSNLWSHSSLRVPTASMSDDRDGLGSDHPKNWLGRRQLAGLAATSGLIAAAPSHAIETGPNNWDGKITEGGTPDRVWEINLPPNYVRKTDIIISKDALNPKDWAGIRSGTVLFAEDEATGAQAEVVFIPVVPGKARSTNAPGLTLFDFDREILMKFFNDIGALYLDKYAIDDIKDCMIDGLRRNGIAEPFDDNYVKAYEDRSKLPPVKNIRFTYMGAKCDGKMEDKECSGTLGPRRRYMATLAKGTVAQTVKTKDGDKDIIRDVLWLVKMSVPESANWQDFRNDFKDISESFSFKTKLLDLAKTYNNQKMSR